MVESVYQVSNSVSTYLYKPETSSVPVHRVNNLINKGINFSEKSTVKAHTAVFSSKSTIIILKCITNDLSDKQL